jgi:hypothetical protein
MANVPYWKRQPAGEGFFHVDHLARHVEPFMPPCSHDCAEIFFVEDGIGTHCILESDTNLSLLHVAARASSVRFLETRSFDSNAHQIKEETTWE